MTQAQTALRWHRNCAGDYGTTDSTGNTWRVIFRMFAGPSWAIYKNGSTLHINAPTLRRAKKYIQKESAR